MVERCLFFVKPSLPHNSLWMSMRSDGGEDYNDDDGYCSASSENMTSSSRVRVVEQLPPLDSLSYARMPQATSEQRKDFLGAFVACLLRYMSEDPAWVKGVVLFGSVSMIFVRREGSAGWTVCLHGFPHEQLRDVYGCPMVHLSHWVDRATGHLIVAFSRHPSASSSTAARSYEEVMAYMSCMVVNVLCYPDVVSTVDLYRVLVMATNSLTPGQLVRAQVHGLCHKFMYDFYRRDFCAADVPTS